MRPTSRQGGRTGREQVVGTVGRGLVQCRRISPMPGSPPYGSMPIPGSPPIPGIGGGTITCRHRPPRRTGRRASGRQLPMSYSVIPSGSAAATTRDLGIWAAPPVRRCPAPTPQRLRRLVRLRRESQVEPEPDLRRVKVPGRHPVLDPVPASAWEDRRRASHTGRSFGPGPSCAALPAGSRSNGSPTRGRPSGAVCRSLTRANGAPPSRPPALRSSTGRPTWTYSAFPPMYGNGIDAAGLSSSLNASCPIVMKSSTVFSTPVNTRPSAGFGLRHGSDPHPAGTPPDRS